MNKKIYILSGIFLVLLAITMFLKTSIASDPEKEYILVEIYDKDGNFILINKTLEKGNYPKAALAEDEYEYRVNILSGNGEIIYSTSFDDPLIIFTDDFRKDIIEGGAVRLKETEFYLLLPNLKEADKIEIQKAEETGIQNGEIKYEKVFEADIYDVGAKPCRIR